MSQPDTRGRADALIVRNAAAQKNLAPRSRAAANPAGQWWNLPAKIAAGRLIADEELQQPGHNDMGDAMRHGNWSGRMAREIDPIFAAAAGLEHEIEGLVIPRKDPRDQQFKTQPFGEAVMDMINNSEGIAAAKQGRAINPANLQDHPLSFRGAYSKAVQHLEDVSPDRAAYPSKPYGQGTAARGYKMRRGTMRKAAIPNRDIIQSLNTRGSLRA